MKRELDICGKCEYCDKETLEYFLIYNFKRQDITNIKKVKKYFRDYNRIFSCKVCDSFLNEFNLQVPNECIMKMEYEILSGRQLIFEGIYEDDNCEECNYETGYKNL